MDDDTPVNAAMSQSSSKNNRKDETKRIRTKIKRAQTKLAFVFFVLSDDKTLQYFRTVAEQEASSSTSTSFAGGNNNKTVVLSLAESNLTRKQYYHRIESLLEAGLIRRRGAQRYSLTSFGKAIYHLQIQMEKAVQLQTRLKAIDSILMAGLVVTSSSDNDNENEARKQVGEENVNVSKQELSKLNESIVGRENQEIKDILLK
jgi:hypothetical protein